MKYLYLIGIFALLIAKVSAVTSIAADNAAWVYSPYNWFVDTSGHTAKTINAGAYGGILFNNQSTSTLTMHFSVGAMATPASQVLVRINGNVWQQKTVAANVTVNMPTIPAASYPNNSFLEFIVKSTTETANRWNSPQNTAVILTSVDFDTGAGVSSPGRRSQNILFIGDSITEGVNTRNASQSNDTDNNDALAGWAYFCGKNLNTEFGIVGFGGQGLIDHGGSGNVPLFKDSVALLWASQARSFSPQPDVIVIHAGTNDNLIADPTANYTAMLNTLLSACPSPTQILCINPWSGVSTDHGPMIQAAIAACSTPSRLHYFSQGWGFQSSYDGTHPSDCANLYLFGPGIADQILGLTIAPNVYAIRRGWLRH